ncbi:hypothetical protein BJV74DRAFT_827205 [Russula compacta]|nr:hypothetical protein BJV74DRAFT_827205 [Russula compacta]
MGFCTPRCTLMDIKKKKKVCRGRYASKDTGVYKKAAYFYQDRRIRQNFPQAPSWRPAANCLVFPIPASPLSAPRPNLLCLFFLTQLQPLNCTLTFPASSRAPVPAPTRGSPSRGSLYLAPGAPELSRLHASTMKQAHEALLEKKIPHHPPNY